VGLGVLVGVATEIDVEVAVGVNVFVDVGTEVAVEVCEELMTVLVGVSVGAFVFVGWTRVGMTVFVGVGISTGGIWVGRTAPGVRKNPIQTGWVRMDESTASTKESGRFVR